MAGFHLSVGLMMPCPGGERQTVNKESWAASDGAGANGEQVW